jgi:hypothetical protein
MMNVTIKRLAWIVSAGILLAQAGPVLAADALTEKYAAQNKLLAMRAARVDAMRKLAERINGLVITSETTVKDFVATSDMIQSSMMSWLRGMKEVGEPVFTPDGICQVTLEVTVQEIVVELQRLCRQYYKGNKFAVADFEKITVNTTEKAIRETGSGAPRPEFDPRGELAPPTAGGQDIMSKNAWAYWTAHCTGQGRLMTARAARLDAYRKLGERINGLLITSDTTVKDFVATDDRIQTAMATFLRGAKEIGTRYHESELIAEVELQITVQELIATLERFHKEYYQGNRVAVADIEKINTRIEEKDIRETGMGVPPDQYLKDLGPDGTAAMAVAQQAIKWPPVATSTGQAAIDTENANAAQAKLMAMRGAELDARRKLAEKLDGLMISSNTSVKDFVALNDVIQTSMLTFQQGARRVNGSEKVLGDGTVEVTVEIELEPLTNMVLYYQKKLSLTIK